MQTCRQARWAAPLLTALVCLAPVPALAAGTGLASAPPLPVTLLTGLLRGILYAGVALWVGLVAGRLWFKVDPARHLTRTRQTLVALVVLAPLDALAFAVLKALPGGLGLGAVPGFLTGVAGALALARWLLAGAGLLAAYAPATQRRPWLQAGPALLALAATVWLLVLPPPPPAPAPLVLAENAEDVLVQLSYVPGRFRVDLSDARLRPVAGAAVDLHLVPLRGQGGERRLSLAQGLLGYAYAPNLKSASYTAAGTLDPGRWRLDVSVGRRAQAPVGVSFYLDGPGTDAAPLLQKADDAMNRLRSLRQREWFGYGPDALITDLSYAAPDRMHFQTNQGFERLAIGAVMYEREQGQTWSKGPWPGLKPYAWPDFGYARAASDVRLVDHDSVDGRPCLVIAFLHASGARFRWWIDAQDYRVHRSVMMAPGHFMRDEYSDYDQPVSIAAPLP